MKARTFVPPTRGWISNENIALAIPGGAKVLENWFPTQTGIRLRAGSSLHATIGTDDVEAMFAYVSGATKRFFAADANEVFNVTSPADPEVAPAADISGQTSGYYSSTPFETAGGNFLYIVNGADSAQLYDGTDWVQITGEQTFGLAYDAQTGNFTVGQIVTGGTSGATATITADDDQGATGTLSIQSITGTFQNNETITDPVTGSATSNIPSGVTTLQSIAITGVATADLSHIWSYRNRLYFIEGGTNSAWYLPVDALGGAATEVSLAGVFQRGGSLLLGATWSLDAGDGVDDKAVFISDNGELAVYEGSFPGGTDWRLVGRYDISPPLGKNATMQAGGDLLIATKDGIVPVSESINKDPAALSLAAVTRAIEPDWQEYVTARSSLPWELLKWPEFNMGIVALPVVDSTTPAECVVVNLETGAWAKYTGWDTRSLVLHDGRAYFGTSGGKILKAEDGGSDNGSSYVCAYVGLFDPLKEFGATKTAKMARATFISGRPFIPKVSVSVNYTVTLPSAPSAIMASADDLWDVGLWDVAEWSGIGERRATTKWNSVTGVGFVHAPQVQVTCNETGTPDAALAAFDLVYEAGGVVV